MREGITQHVAGLSTDLTVAHPFTLTRRVDGVPVLLDLAAMYRPSGLAAPPITQRVRNILLCNDIRGSTLVRYLLLSEAR